MDVLEAFAKFLSNSLGYQIPIAVMFVCMAMLVYENNVNTKRYNKLMNEYNNDKMLLINRIEDFYKEENKYLKTTLANERSKNK